MQAVRVILQFSTQELANDPLNRLADRSALLQSTLGIKQIQPMPNGELRILYNLNEGKTATLAIYSDVERRRVTGAKVYYYISAY